MQANLRRLLYSPRVHQRGHFLGIAIVGVLIGLSAWFHVGPYRWAVDAQLRMIGAYYPFWTWVGLFTLFGIPAGLVSSELTERWSVNDKLHDWHARFGWLVLTRAGQLLSAGLIFAVVGAVMSTRAMMMGARTELSVVALEHGATPESAWVQIVDGEPDLESTIEFDHHTYVPVFGEGDRAALFLEIDHVDGDLVHSGLVSENSLPNVVRASFEDAGMIASTHYVVELGKDPASEARSMRFLGIFGVVLFAIGGVVRLVDRRRS